VKQVDPARQPQADLTEQVRQLRARGYTPKAIARALVLPPAQVAPLIRTVAAQAEAATGQAELVGCWISAGWSHELIVEPRPQWPDAAPAEGTTGLTGVLIARRAPRRRGVSVCGYLVDTHCLGVKNALGPQVMDEHALTKYTGRYFQPFQGPPLQVPLDLAQHLVYGAVDYARTLGFEPHPDFHPVAGHLGTWTGPCAITFGRNGTPFYVDGPDDDPGTVIRTLDRTVGKGNYQYIISAGPLI
jgi:hypothetical protein